MNFKCKFPRIVAIAIMFLSTAYFAYADFASIAVAPVTKSIALSQGETESGVFTVYNNSDEPQSVIIEPRYWHMVDENRTIPLESWLRIDPLEFDMGPREKRMVRYIASAPEGAIGELAAMIAFRPKPKADQELSVVFSVSLYARMKDTEKISGEIKSLKLWKYEDKNSLGIRLILENTGNVHLKPKIQVFIQNLFNKNLYKATLKFGKPAYPGKTQDYHGAIHNYNLKPGLYRAYVYAEDVNIVKRIKKKIYFIVGRDGKPVFTFFRRPKE